MSREPDNNPNASRRIEDLIDAYFDRELPAEDEAALAHLLKRDAGAAMLFSESEAAIEALRAPVNAPDLTQDILAEVGHRRGWIGARLQRFVSVGRVALAACLLLALALTLTARRFAPEAPIFPNTPTPVSNIADCAADDTNCGVGEIMAAIDQMGATTRLSEMRSAIPMASFHAIQAGFLNSFGMADPATGDVVRGVEFEPSAFELTIAIGKGGCLKKLNVQQQVGAVVYIGRKAPAAPAEEEPESTVGGW